MCNACNATTRPYFLLDLRPFLQCSDDLLEELEVLPKVLRSRLRRPLSGGNPVKLLDLKRVGVLEGRAYDLLAVGFAFCFAHVKGGRNLPYVRRVVLDFEGLVLAVDLDVSVEAPLTVYASLEGYVEVIVLEDRVQEAPVFPLRGRED